MCYTSGTTGNPKGVVYSHRSTFLHTMSTMMADTLGARESDRILPVVPMFHANAWGLAHSGVASGADLVMPGPDLSGPAIADLIVEERVTVAAGVPTIWMQVLPNLAGRDTSRLRAIPCGGSAVPKALSVAYREQLGLPILQAWGMTETSPVVSVCRLDGDQEPLPVEEQDDLRTGIGRSAFGVECRIVEPGTTAGPPRRHDQRGAAVPRQLDRHARTTTTRGPTTASPMTAGCARATSPRWTPGGGCGSSTAPRTSSSPVASGSLGGAGERADGAPEDPRGGGDRGPRRQVVASGRWRASCSSRA